MADLNALVTIAADDQASDQLDRIAGGFGKMGDSAQKAHLLIAGAVAGIGAAAIGLGVAAFKLGESFDEAFDRIRVGTGATGEKLEALQGNFRNVAAGVPDSFEKVGVAITEISRRIGVTDSSLDELATTFLNLSRITGTDLNENIRLIGRVFADSGVAADDYEETLNKIFRASQLTGVSIQSLSDNLVQFGSPLRLLGFTLDEQIALLAKFESEGVRTELVMGSLRIAIGNLAQAGIPLREGLEEVFRVIREAPSDADAASKAIAVFGARAGPDMAAAIREGRFAIDGLVNDLVTGTDTINTATAETEDARERMGRAFNQIKLAAEPVATAVFVIAGAVAESLGGSLQTVGPDIAAFIKSLSPDTTDAAKKAAAGTVTFSEAINDTIVIVRGAATALGILNAILDDIPKKFGLAAKGAELLSPALFGIANAIRLANDLIEKFGETAAKPLGPDLGELQAGAIERARTGSTGGRLAPRTVDESAPGVGITNVGPLAGRNTPEGDAVRRTEDAIRRAQERANQAHIDISKLFETDKDKEKTGRKGREAAETAIEGFIEGLRGGEANAQAEFGSLGGKLATALNSAVASNSKSGGLAVSKALEDVVTALREAGVEDWRQLGDDLAAALHDALIARTPAQVDAARAMIAEMSRTIDAAQFWQQWAKAGEEAATRINVATDSTAEKIAAAYKSARDKVQELWDNLNLNRRLEGARKAVDDIVQFLQGTIDKARQATQDQRADRDTATGRLRADADAQAAHEARLAEIRKRGGPTVGLDIRAENAAFEAARARTALERSRQDADRQQGLADRAADEAAAKAGQAKVDQVRRGLQLALGISPAQLQEAEIARQTARIWDQARTDAGRFNQELADTIATQQAGLNKKWDELEKRFPSLKSQADEVFDKWREDLEAGAEAFESVAGGPRLTPEGELDVGGGGRLVLPGDRGSRGGAASLNMEVKNYGIVVDQPTFTSLILSGQQRLLQTSAAVQGA